MWRWGMCLAAVAVLISGVAKAQVAGDPGAVAPVVYSNASSDDSPCNNDSDSPPIPCAAAEPGDAADADEVETAPDYVDDDYEGPVYAATADFYPGISLLPVDYWDPGFGWPYFGYTPYYYGFATFGFGWPYWDFSWHGGGYWRWHHHHDHYAWHGHHHDGWNRYQYRHNDHGRADQRHDSAKVTRAERPNSMRRSNAPLRDRPVPTHSAANIVRNDMPRRDALPSASYVNAQRSSYAGSRLRSPLAAGHSPATTYRSGANRIYPNDLRARSVNMRNAGSAYRVTSLPNRGYSTPYRPPSGVVTRTPRAYAPARATYSAPHYSGGYAGGRSAMPAHSGNGASSAHANASAGPSGASSTRRH